MAIALLGIALGGCGGGDDEGSDNAHINHASGRSNGAIPDNRVGTPPPVAKEQDESLAKLADRASCRVFIGIGESGNEELPPGSKPPKYETEPAISGPHVEPPHQQADGAYRSRPATIDYVGSLDYGRMEIQYAPDLSEKIQLELKGLYDTMYGGTLLFPNEVMNYAVTATSWRNTLVCTAWAEQDSIEAIRAFGKKTWGKSGNEPMDDFPVEGPTPANPAA
ncbi:MAG TPA: DUF3105 domain-containing protein [Solirubrobacterales bacterium]|nr:DUF3105 domain-containing protein [Solirubrobacterales bacterium]